MSNEARATEFVRRTNEALGDLDRADEIWTASVQSTTSEIRLHSLSLELDNAIRRVTGPFETWAELDPSQVQDVAERGPINLLWVLSAHPSGRVREAVVHQTKDLGNDRILPHLANRSIDFVPQIRDAANPMVMARFEEALAAYAGPENPGVLPTPVHIAVTKLLAPRTGMVSPELMQICIDLATASDMHLPRSFRGGGIVKMIDRCERTLLAAPEAASRTAIEALIAYFNQAPVT